MRDLVFDVSAADHMSAGSGSGLASAAGSGKAHAFADDAARDLRAGPHVARISREMAGWSRRCRSAEAAARSCAWTSAGSSFGPSP